MAKNSIWIQNTYYQLMHPPYPLLSKLLPDSSYITHIVPWSSNELHLAKEPLQMGFSIPGVAKKKEKSEGSKTTRSYWFSTSTLWLKLTDGTQQWMLADTITIFTPKVLWRRQTKSLITEPTTSGANSIKSLALISKTKMSSLCGHLMEIVVSQLLNSASTSSTHLYIQSTHIKSCNGPINTLPL